MKHFYSHLISIESLVIELDSMELSDKEKMHLTELIDSSLHHTVLDAILAELDEDDKKLFFKHLREQKHDKIWEILNTKAEGIESKIQKVAEELKKELHEDIKEAKKLKIDDGK
jgi:(p)ppGpp synthase/HD superfamily hydrolase